MKTSFFIIGFLGLSILTGCRNRVYKAGSGSMENTIRVGEKFIVAQTDVFQRNDIIVFDYYGPDYTSEQDENGQFKLHWEKRIYRVAAASGDVIKITDGDLFVNERHIPAAKNAKTEYEIKSQVAIDDLNEYDENAYLEKRIGDTLIYLAQLTADIAAGYRQKKPAVFSVEKWSWPRDPARDTLFARNSADDNWTADEYGPIHIPRPGQTITVNAGNYKLYKNIPGVEMGQFVIKEKLYFVIGDNWHSAEDSRYIGLISESKIFGVVKNK